MTKPVTLRYLVKDKEGGIVTIFEQVLGKNKTILKHAQEMLVHYAELGHTVLVYVKDETQS